MIIGFLISSFFSSIQIINQKSKSKINLKYDLKFSWKTTLLIPFSGVVIYAIIIFLASSSFYNLITIILKLFPFGILLSIISFYSFNRIYRLRENSNRKIIIICYYILSVLVVLFFSASTNLLEVMAYRSTNELIKNIVLVSLALYSPYYLFVIGVNHFYFLQQLNIQENNILKQQSLESQINYQQLKNQLSPHFLFNNINVLSSFIEENPKKAVTYANNLANIYHYFLEQEKEDVVKVREEINFAKQYLELLKDRFEEGLQYHINIDENIKDNYITATILQQVLENVVKHNIIDKNSVIKISISSSENYLVISNNKNLKQQEKSRSKKGIENIQKRIAFFTDKKVIIENTDRNYTVKLPILETV